LILIASVVIGALAAVVVWNYVNDADTRAQGNAAQVPVLVVKQDIPRGLTGAEAVDGGYISEDEIPTKFRPNSAVLDEASIRTFVAVNQIPANSVLVQGMFVSPEEALTGNSELLKENKVAVTVSVDQIRGVAGLVVPGDFVNIFLTAHDDQCQLPTSNPGAAGGNEGAADDRPNYFDLPAAPTGEQYLCKPARSLYQKVQVLFVDKTTVPQPGQTTAPTDTTEGDQAPEQINTGLITFAVTPQAAQVIASVNSDQLYLTLVAPDYSPIPLPQLDTFTNGAPLPGEDGGQLTPYGPTGLQGD
jgi:Flp pilus assembly protein CpaB